MESNSGICQCDLCKSFCHSWFVIAIVEGKLKIKIKNVCVDCVSSKNFWYLKDGVLRYNEVFKFSESSITKGENNECGRRKR